jgi:hypothetical protein
MTTQLDPLQSIRIALNGILTLQPFNLKNVILGWPDDKYFQVDNNLPSLAIFQVSDSGSHKVSRETTHAVVNNADGVTSTVYKERLRVTYLVQLSLFTYTEQDRSNIGWMIQQYLVSNPQLVLDANGVETSIFSYKGQHNPPGETKFYQRDMNFEVTARVLDISTAYRAKTITMNDNTPLK